MMKNIKYFVSLIAFFMLLPLAGCNSNDGYSDVTSKEPGSRTPTLERIDIAASPKETNGVSQLSLTSGNQQEFVAVGYFSDGTVQTLDDLVKEEWVSSDSELATFYSPYILTASDSVGIVEVYVKKEGVVSNVLEVSITAPILTSLVVTPSIVDVAKGQYLQLTSMGHYSDGTSVNISSSVVWTSSDNDIATVDTSGLLSGRTKGETEITASEGGLTSNSVRVNVSSAQLQSISVTPLESTIAKGQVQALTAAANYSDNSTSDISEFVQWIVLDETVATVRAPSFIYGENIGTTAVSGFYNGVESNAVDVIVTDAVVTDIVIMPGSVSLAQGEEQQLEYITTYSDGSTSGSHDQVSWISADPEVAIVTSTGLLTGGEVGNTTIWISLDGVVSNVVDVEVTDAFITDINVTPETVMAVKGLTRNLTATATYSDASLSRINDSASWDIDDTDVATVLDGVLMGADVGNARVTASKDGITSDDINVTVCEGLASSCIDIYDLGEGKLFTSSPSVNYLDSINVTGGEMTHSEDGSSGPVGVFQMFTWVEANALCSVYNDQNVSGRKNWRLATLDELSIELFADVTATQDMFMRRTWPTEIIYWSATTNGDRYYVVYLDDGDVFSNSPNNNRYVSCVSEAVNN